MKATELLERQHRNLRELCEALEQGSTGVRTSLLPQLANDLAAHIAVEEQVLYPAARAALSDEGWMREGHRQRLETRHLLHRALRAAPDGDDFAAAIGALRGAVTRHVHEDEDMLFPRLEKALDASAMRELGRSIAALYDKTVDSGFSPD